MNMQNVMISLEIMAKGMGGIFAALILIMLFVYLMSKLGKK